MKFNIFLNIIACIIIEIFIGYKIIEHPSSNYWILIITAIFYPVFSDFMDVIKSGIRPRAIRGIISVLNTGKRKNRDEEYYTGKFYLYNAAVCALIVVCAYIFN